jgi:hypothetical protein
MYFVPAITGAINNTQRMSMKHDNFPIVSIRLPHVFPDIIIPNLLMITYSFNSLLFGFLTARSAVIRVKIYAFNILQLTPVKQGSFPHTLLCTKLQHPAFRDMRCDVFPTPLGRYRINQGP